MPKSMPEKKVISCEQAEALVKKWGRNCDEDPLQAQDLVDMIVGLSVPNVEAVDISVFHRIMAIAGFHKTTSATDRALKKMPHHEKALFWKKFSSRMSASAKVMGELLEMEEVPSPFDTDNTARMYSYLYCDFEDAAEPADIMRFAPTPNDQNPIPAPPLSRQLRVEFTKFEETLKWSASIGKYLMKKAEEEKKHSMAGRKADEHNDALIMQLAYVYEEVTGTEPKIPHYDSITESYGGKFLSFAAPCITALEPGLKHNNIATRMKRVLKNRVSTMGFSQSVNLASDSDSNIPNK